MPTCRRRRRQVPQRASPCSTICLQWSYTMVDCECPLLRRGRCGCRRYQFVMHLATLVTSELLRGVRHSGGGHYMSYVRRRAPDALAAMRGESKHPSGPLTDEWLWFSDQHCGAVPVEEVMAAEAYILFYERV